MSKFKGTPGPWYRVGKTVYALNGQGFNRFSALVQDAHTSDEELEANARLFSVAPKLLDAAIMAIEHYDEFFKGVEPPEDLPWVPVMREAIKEALGEDAP